MKNAKISQQLSDLFAYLLIPGLAIILPASFSRLIIAKASCWQWLMASAADVALGSAQDFVDINDEAAFKKVISAFPDSKATKADSFLFKE